jgi:hypothetical protein
MRNLEYHQAYTARVNRKVWHEIRANRPDSPKAQWLKACSWKRYMKALETCREEVA